MPTHIGTFGVCPTLTSLHKSKPQKSQLPNAKDDFRHILKFPLKKLASANLIQLSLQSECSLTFKNTTI